MFYSACKSIFGENNTGFQGNPVCFDTAGNWSALQDSLWFKVD
jgi:hypothetical protein